MRRKYCRAYREMDGVTSIDGDFIISLSEKAKKSQRKRVVHELHASHQSPCQRILNAIEPESYIRPHRHVDRDEYFTCLSGCLICIFFTEDGQIEDVVDISVHSDVASIIVGVEIARWHTVLSLKSGSVLFETKDGPFRPALSKEFAAWSPCENDTRAAEYLSLLKHRARLFLQKKYKC